MVNNWDLDANFLDQTESDLKRMTIWTPKAVPDNYIRMLPPWNELGRFFFVAFMHWNIGPTEKAFPCRETMWSKPCLLCALYRKFLPKQPERAKLFLAKKRFYLNIIDLKDIKSGVQVWSCGSRMISTILGYIRDPRWGNLTHPQTGRNCTIGRTGKGLDSEFQFRPDPDHTALQDMTWLDQLVQLDDMFTCPTNEAIKKALTTKTIQNPIGNPESEHLLVGKDVIGEFGDNSAAQLPGPTSTTETKPEVKTEPAKVEPVPTQIKDTETPVVDPQVDEQLEKDLKEVFGEIAF